MPDIRVNQSTYEALDLAARLTGLEPGKVVERLVAQSRREAPSPSPSTGSDEQTLEIFADYEGHRTAAAFDRLTNRIDILDGPLAGQSFKSPSSAARAVVAHYKPHVNPHRNGWTFWMLDDATGRFLQSVRAS